MAKTALNNFIVLLSQNEVYFYEQLYKEVETKNGAISEDLQQFFLKQLYEKPYPSVQILNSIINELNCSVQLISTVFAKYITANNKKVLNFLANIKFPEQLSKSTQENILQNLHAKKNELSADLYYSLLSRDDECKLLRKFIEIEQQQAPILDKKALLYKTVYKKEHVILDFIRKESPTEIVEEYFRNVICILKLVNFINSSSRILDDERKLQGIFSLFSVSQMTTIQRIFFTDLCRIQNILRFSRKHFSKPFDIQTILESRSTLDMLSKKGQMLSIGYDEIKSFLDDEQEICQSSIDARSKSTKDIEILSYFFTLVTFFEIIVNNNVLIDYERDIDKKLSEATVMLRQIKDIDVLSNLIEDIFRLIFLRWENLNINKMIESFRTASSSTDIETGITSATTVSERHGFICRSLGLQKILQYLKNITAKRFHTDDFKQSNEHSQIRFTKISENINDALWKYSLFEKNTTESKGFLIDPDELIQIVQYHTETCEKTSSDDESKEKRLSSMSRRRLKAKKRIGLTASQISQNKDSQDDGNRLKNVLQKDDRNIIVKMLGSPENLATISLSDGNFSMAKHIIQIFNLQSTELEKELTFLENMQQTEKKLKIIFEKYKEQKNENSSNSTIQHIKKVAAIGFEASKISSVIEKYSQTNNIQQNKTIQTLLQKFCNNYPFLLQYQGNSLKATIILDLVLNSSFNFEISSNVYHMTERLYGQNLLDDMMTNSQNVLINKEIGCLPFFKNLIDCLYLLNATQKTNIEIKEVLINNCYSLKPNKLSVQLVKEEAFKHLFVRTNAEISDVQDLKFFIKHFDNFYSRVNYFARFYNYLKNLSKLLQLEKRETDLTTIEMLKFDPTNVIGNLIFKQDMTPMEIENVVSSLNLNFLYVIALNICPEMRRGQVGGGVAEASGSKFNNRSILHFIGNQNILLGFILQEINKLDIDANVDNKDYFSRLVDLPEIESVSVLYNNNLSISALLFDIIDINKLKEFSDRFIACSIIGNFIENTKIWPTLQPLRDSYIVELISINGSYAHLIEYVSDIKKRSSIICDHYTKIHDSKLLERLIKGVLLHKNINELNDSIKTQLMKILKETEIYTKIADLLSYKTWKQAYENSLFSPVHIMEELLKRNNYELCLNWSIIINLPEKVASKLKITFSLILIELIQFTENIFDKSLLQLIETFPLDDVIQFYDMNLDKMRSLPLLDYIVKFLLNNNKNNNDITIKSAYNNYRISLKIFELLSLDEREQNWNIFSKPLLLIEQFIMNSKFEILTDILKNIKSLLHHQKCKYCYNKKGYDMHSKPNINFILGNDNSTDFLLLNFNLYQKDHAITIECIDLILRIYATKALDYHINEIYSSSEKVSQSTDMASLDSLCGAFVMPKTAPTKEHWIKDEEAAHCMCCKRSVFTMLIRRHHCRRCGRVVCFSCSTNRMKISELYEDVLVRVCNDCFKQAEAIDSKQNKKSLTPEVTAERRLNNDAKWLLSGSLTHDKLLREEFCFEHAPSVALCLSILSFHTNDQECVNLLLYHCRNLEKLLRPNPEVDYILVAKMLSCLAVAAKVRGGPPECDTIRDHSEIIMSVVQNDCKSLLPSEPLRNHSLRKLGDSLVLIEKWSLALEVFLKCGFPTAGVMAAHGLSCLRAGCFDTAREKFTHCMTRICKESDCFSIIKFIANDPDVDIYTEIDIPIIKRPNRSPPLLEEITKIIESTANVPQPETLARASVIRSSNTSLASNRSKRKENIPIHEPALNILNTLSNLKQIARGHYTSTSLESLDNKNSLLRHSRVFEECLYYLLTYGSHGDVINFLIRHEQYTEALKYFILQHVSNDIFVQNIYLHFLKCGKVDLLIEHILKMDDRIIVWKDAIISTCRYLEIKNMLHSLYQLQLLLKDPVRASMTCVKFYSMNCCNFRELQNNSFHLVNAQIHLQTELELCQWENIHIEKKREPIEATFLMQMDAKALNSHINTIQMQMEVTKFLAKCEEDDKTGKLTQQILKEIRLDTTRVPTLFDSMQEKIQLCILVLLCGKNKEEGYGLCFRIIQDFKLPTINVYVATAKYLARNNRISEVDSLINCIISNSGMDRVQNDSILSAAVYAAVNIHEPETKTILDNLIKKISDIEAKISCHIYIGQLKAAYLLAVQYERLNDVRRILRHAETTNQYHVKNLCEKKLNITK